MGQTIPHHGPSQNGTVKLSTTKPTSEFTSGHVGVAVSLQRFSLRENHHHQDTELIETLNREVCGSSLLSYWCSSAMKTVDEFNSPSPARGMNCHGVAVVVVEVFRDLARIPRSKSWWSVFRRAGNQKCKHIFMIESFTVEPLSNNQTSGRSLRTVFRQIAQPLEAIWTKLLKRFVRRTGLGRYCRSRACIGYYWVFCWRGLGFKFQYPTYPQFIFQLYSLY